MKKLLAFLSSVAVISTGSSTIVACSIKADQKVASTEENTNISENNNGAEESKTEKILLKLWDIKAMVQDIKNLKDVDAVNLKLQDIVAKNKPTGVKKLSAALVEESPADVVVTITTEPTFAMENDENSFKIEEAIKVIKIISSQSIYDVVKDIKNLSDDVTARETFNALTIEGVSRLSLGLINWSLTDCTLTIYLKPGYALDGPKSYILESVVSIDSVPKPLVEIYQLFRDAKNEYGSFKNAEKALNKISKYIDEHRTRDLIAMNKENPTKVNQMLVDEIRIVAPFSSITLNVHYKWATEVDGELVWINGLGFDIIVQELSI